MRAYEIAEQEEVERSINRLNQECAWEEARRLGYYGCHLCITSINRKESNGTTTDLAPHAEQSTIS